MRVVERVRIHSLFRELAPEEREHSYKLIFAPLYNFLVRDICPGGAA